MTKEEILEADKLIAEFMGLIPNKYDGGKTYAINPQQLNGELVAEKWEMPKYHSSFDWLMPVVEKIEKDTSASIYHRFTVVIADVYCHIKCHEKGKQDGVLYQTPYGTTPESKISEVWQAVLQFITWYNSTNPTTIK